MIATLHLLDFLAAECQRAVVLFLIGVGADLDLRTQELGSIALHFAAKVS